MYIEQFVIKFQARIDSQVKELEQHEVRTIFFFKKPNRNICFEIETSEIVDERSRQRCEQSQTTTEQSQQKEKQPKQHHTSTSQLRREEEE